MAKHVLHDEISAEVVRLLIAERKRQGISGNSLAAKSGLSQSLISSLETNPWNPTLGTLLRMGDSLQLDIGAVISQARRRLLKSQGKSAKSPSDIPATRRKKNRQPPV